MPDVRKVFSPFRQPVWRGHAFGVALFLLALVVRLAVNPFLPPGFPFVTFFPAVILTTFVAGLWPGVMVAILSGLAALWFFIPPVESLTLDSSRAMAVGFYLVIVGVDIALIEIMNAALSRLDEERRRSAALTRQAEVMFSELQHRVSNNLQLISSLLMIQAAEVRDPTALRALEDARKRVATVGRLHRMLHNPGDQRLDMGAYLEALCRDVFEAAGAHNVRWSVAAAPVEITGDQVVPTALIATELLSNALEHGFAGGRSGQVDVTLHPAGQSGFTLVVRDNGVGLPEGFRLDEQTSLGLHMVRALARQLDGHISMEGGQGTRCVLTVRGT